MVDENLMPVARRLTIVALSLIGLSIVLSHFSVDISGLVATLGIGSLALALAAQAALGDTISGFVIMVDRPFRVGDRIEILDLDTWGNVVDIGLRSSRIVTQDNRMVIVPNSVIGRSLIVNHSFPDSHYRLETHVGIAYGTDIDEAREVIINAVQAAEGVMEEKRVEGLFMEFGDSALVFRVRWWIRSYVDYYVMYDRVNSAIYKALNEAGIGIPFPQRDVHHYVDDNAIPNIEWVARSARGGGK
jgi:small-conductance mechanosensitive channel